MSKHRQSNVQARLQATGGAPKNRPHEGSNVPAIIGQTTVVNGLEVKTAAIKLDEAPVPERKYVADVCGLTYEPGTVKLLFGQRRIGSEGLRSLLVIQMFPSGVARFMSAIDQVSPHSLDHLAQAAGIQAEQSKPITEEPAQTVALAAGFCLFAASPEETTLDFYQASAFAMSNMVHSRKLAVDPVVRIDLRTSLLLALVHDIRRLGPKIPFASQSEISK